MGGSAFLLFNRNYMADEDEEYEVPEYQGTVPNDIQSKIENTIKTMLDAPDLATQAKGATLAVKMGMGATPDRNIKVGELATRVADIMFVLSMTHGYSIHDLTKKMVHTCRSCRRIGRPTPRPKVIR
jgi:hypothetical protein